MSDSDPVPVDDPSFLSRLIRRMLPECKHKVWTDNVFQEKIPVDELGELLTQLSVEGYDVEVHPTKAEWDTHETRTYIVSGERYQCSCHARPPRKRAAK